MPRNVAHMQKNTPVFSFLDVLPICDFIAVLFAAYASTVFCSLTAESAAIAASYIAPQSLIHAWSDRGNMALIGASLATYILYEQNFATAARHGKTASLVFSYAVRALGTIAMIALIGYATSLIDSLPQAWLLSWLGFSISATALLRMIGARRIRRNAATLPHSFAATTDITCAKEVG